MIILAAVIILISVSLVILAIRLVRPEFPYLWLISVSISFLIWLAILFASLFLPIDSPIILPLFVWQPDFLFPVSPAILIDQISMPVVLALVTLNLAATLTDAGRKTPGDQASYASSGWAASMMLTALAIFSVISENILTLLIAWSAVDVAELLIWITNTGEGVSIERVVVKYSTRIGGIIAVIAAGMVANQSGTPLGFSAANPDISLLLLLAVGLRLGIIPPNVPINEPQNSKGADVVLQLAPVAVSLSLLPRINVPNISSGLFVFIFFITGLAVIYSGITWFSARSTNQGAPFWVMGISGLALMAALGGNSSASLAWTSVVILAGGLLLLYHSRHRFLRPLALIAAFGLLMFPYTPTWPSAQIFNPISLISILLLIFQSLLAAGYILRSLDPEPALSDVERWVWLFYPSGLTLLLLVFYLQGWRLISTRGAWVELGISQVWPAIVSAIIVTIFVIIRRRRAILPKHLLTTIQSFFSMEWLYRLFWGAFYLLRRFFAAISMLLEGRAGILWALLLLALLFSIISQVGLGG